MSDEDLLIRLSLARVKIFAKLGRRRTRTTQLVLAGSEARRIRCSN
jgi:hypothetical protein